MVRWCIGAFGVIVHKTGLDRCWAAMEKWEAGIPVAVQGLWRSALGHMHHTSLQRIMKRTWRRWVTRLRCGAGLAGCEVEGIASFSNALHMRI
jgi:hypothetical protein